MNNLRRDPADRADHRRDDRHRGARARRTTSSAAASPVSDRGPPAVRHRPRRRNGGAGRVAHLDGDRAGRHSRTGKIAMGQEINASFMRPISDGHVNALCRVTAQRAGRPGTGRSRSRTTPAASARCCAPRSRCGTSVAGPAADSSGRLAEEPAMLFTSAPRAGTTRSGRASFYPAGLPQGGLPRALRRVLNACEVNTTFYRAQGEGDVRALDRCDTRRLPVRGQGASPAHPHASRSVLPAYLGVPREFLESLAPHDRPARLHAGPVPADSSSAMTTPSRQLLAALPQRVPLARRVPPRVVGVTRGGRRLAAQGGTRLPLRDDR